MTDDTRPLDMAGVASRSGGEGRDRWLEALADVPPPRRSDAAFVRSVHDGVARRGRRALGKSGFALPALAMAAAAFTFLVMRHAPATELPRGADVRPDMVLADPFDDEDSLFALPTLDGSSDEELADLDRVLDRRISSLPSKK